ncbi:MAG: hypothetical protein ACRDJH_22025, partial [Thermomicrobiales bacterium]
MRFERLSITGHRGEPVPNELVRQDGKTDHLALLLPGFGYTCDMPLFYYAESLLLDAGVDVFRVEYAYNRREDFLDLPPDGQRAWLLDDVTAAFRSALSQRPYRDLTVIGKSLGTLAMGHLLTTEPPTARTRAVWLTPLLSEDRLRAQMMDFDGRSLLVIGVSDPHYDVAHIDELRTAGHDTVIIDG